MAGDQEPGPSSASFSAEVFERLTGRERVDDRYVLEDEVARGGQGTVLRVWDEDLRRHLAMKKILGPGEGGGAGSQASRSLGRFLEEAQVTGQLDHPGIVPVHELGIDAGGSVFFTMKLVKGEELRTVIQKVHEGREGWTTTRALGVLLKVCEALAYAHSKGVIHRDLKPGNVMVGRFGEVFVMDWGLARVLGQEDAKNIRIRAELATTIVRSERHERATDPESPLVTMDGDVVGTPAFMSPEQARGEIETMGPASDVYSVGAILYHLLAGHVPYCPPGVRLTNYAIWALAQAQAPQPLDEVAPDAPPELVAICERAMARDAAARYADVAELGADLAAFLEHRVVRAYRGGPWMEMRKWVRRNRGLAAALAAALVLALGGLGGVGYVEARGRAAAEAQEQIALANAVEARQQAEIAEAVNEFLNEDLLAAVAPSSEAGRGKDVKMRAVLDIAAARIEEASLPDGRFAGKPRVEAAIRQTLGKTYLLLGEHAAATPHLERAVELFADALGTEHSDTLGARRDLAYLFMADGRHEEAEALLLGNLALAEPRGHDSEVYLEARQLLAAVYYYTGRYADSLAIGLDTADRAEAALGAEHRITILARMNVATIHMFEGRYEEAEALYEETVDVGTRVLGAENPDVLKARLNRASVLLMSGRHREAEPLTRKVLEVCRRVLGPEHPDTLHLETNLGSIALYLGRYAEAERRYSAVMARMERVLGEEHPSCLEVRANLAAAILNQGRVAEAEELARDAYERMARTLGEGHPDTSIALHLRATVAGTQGDYERAEALYVEAIEALERAHGPTHPALGVAREGLATVYERDGRLEDSVAVSTELLATLEETKGADDPHTRRIRDDVARRCNARAWELLTMDPPDPERSARARALAKRSDELYDHRNSNALDTLALAYHRTGDHLLACETQIRALELLPPGDEAQRTQFEERIAEYEAAVDE